MNEGRENKKWPTLGASMYAVRLCHIAFATTTSTNSARLFSARPLLVLLVFCMKRLGLVPLSAFVSCVTIRCFLNN